MKLVFCSSYHCSTLYFSRLLISFQAHNSLFKFGRQRSTMNIMSTLGEEKNKIREHFPTLMARTVLVYKQQVSPTLPTDVIYCNSLLCNQGLNYGNFHRHQQLLRPSMLMDACLLSDNFEEEEEGELCEAGLQYKVKLRDKRPGCSSRPASDESALRNSMLGSPSTQSLVLRYTSQQIQFRPRRSTPCHTLQHCIIHSTFFPPEPN